MPRAIQIDAQSTRYVDDRVDGTRLVITVLQAVDMPVEIFAYLQLPLQPGQTEYVAQFDHVCSPVDLAEYPVGAPLVNAVPPWFRADTVDLVFRSRAEAMDAYNQFVAEGNALCASLDRMDDLTALGTTWLGTPPS